MWERDDESVCCISTCGNILYVLRGEKDMSFIYSHFIATVTCAVRVERIKAPLKIHGFPP